jgi:PAS domain S-box-containing protein
MNHEPLNPSSRFAVVVNDDPTQLDVLSGLLRKAGLEPRAFTAAEAALADMSARAGTADGAPGGLPALVVTDLYMPGIDGWRFCRLLRSPEYAAFNEVPILLVSATYAGEEVDRIAADLGAEAFLHSPVDGKRFVEQVRAILKGRQVLKPLRALIVEDDKSLADKLKKALAAHGYQADIALTAQAADDAFLKAAYDVAVLDHHLPDGAGDALLDAFRAERPDCVCLMMTTDPGPELALDWMKRGAAAYLRKPFKPEYLIELCERARRERALLRVQDLLEVRTRELRESEGKHFVLLEQSSDPIYSVTPEGRYTYVNPAFAAGVGKPVENIIGNSIWDVFPREEAYQRFASLSQVIRTGEEQVIEERVPRADGDRYYITTITPIADAAGKVGSAICSSKDITERKRAEDELRYNSAIIAQANDAIIATKNDAGFTITKWNPGAEKIYGWQEKEVLGRSSMFLQNEYPGQDPRKVLETILEAGLYEGEVIQSRKDGTRVFVDARLIARKDNNGDITDWICINRDITDRKRAEEEKRRLEERSRKIVEDIFRFIPEGVLVFSRKMELLRQNQAFRELVSGYAGRLGFVEDELENLIIDKIKAGLGDKNIKEIRISRKHETGK